MGRDYKRRTWSESEVIVKKTEFRTSLHNYHNIYKNKEKTTYFFLFTVKERKGERSKRCELMVKKTIPFFWGVVAFIDVVVVNSVRFVTTGSSVTACKQER